jgi:hypothetical protein
MNVRRIARHAGEVKAFLSTINKNFHSIVLSEIGDDALHYINETFLDNYDYYTDVPTHCKYGGVCVLIRKDLGPVTVRDDLQINYTCKCANCYSQNKWLEIKHNSKKIILGGIYRHHNGNVDHFTSQLTKTLESLPQNGDCFIAGDMNINLINYDHNLTLNYLTTLMTHNFFPCITLPTRITDTSATVIDHIFAKLSKQKDLLMIQSGNIFNDISDHLPNFLIMPTVSAPPPRENKRPLVRLHSDTNIAKFRELLRATDWESIFMHDDIEVTYNTFINHFMLMYDTACPVVRQSRKRSRDKPWITQGLKISIKHKDKLFKKQLKLPSQHNIVRYKNYRNSLSTCLKTAEQNFYQDLLRDRHNSVNKFWNAFSTTLNPKKSKTRSRLSKLVLSDKTVTDDHDIANGMNDFFCSIGQQIDSNLPRPNGSFANYLHNRVLPTFYLSPVSEASVLRLLNKSNSKKSAGPDNITPKLLKHLSNEIYIPLTRLFNKSIEHAVFPNDWKIAKVITIYKKKSRLYPDNYRPISLLNCFGKILERLVYNQMLKFIDKFKIIYLHQYGFRKWHSTSLALIEIVDSIKHSLDKGDITFGFFLDIRKAFDSINHEILLRKLDHYGFRGHASKFITSYLSNRKQFTVVNDTNSQTHCINYGVPQGSILGPLFFLLFINDLPNAANEATVRLFADDTAIFLSGHETQRLTEQAQIVISKIQTWYLLNRLELSIDKSQFVLFHKPNHPSVNLITEFKIGESIIKRVQDTKYIGVTLDENLNWDKHIANVCKSLVPFYGVFYNIRHFMNDKFARIIYYSTIYSRIQYGIELYGSATKTRLDKIQTIQNGLVKILCKKDRLYRTNDLHADLRILKVKDIYESALLKLAYNWSSGSQIPSFTNFYELRNDIHDYETRNRRNFSTNRYRTNYGKTTARNVSAHLWNNLDPDVQNSTSLNSFNRKIKQKYLNAYLPNS